MDFAWPGFELGEFSTRRASLVKQLGATFDADPSELTGADGSTVTALTNALGGSLALDTTGTTAKPTLDRAHAINGRPALLLASTPTRTELYCTGGPAPGTSPCEFFAVLQLTTLSGADASFPNFILTGSSPLAQTNPANNLQMGARSGEYFLGSYDGTNLQVVTGALDTSLHLMHVAVSGAVVTARLDGVIVGVGALNYNLPAGFGVRAWSASFGIGDARLYRATWFQTQAANLTTAQRQPLEALFGAEYDFAIANRAAAIGTSITAGLGTTTPSTDAWIKQVPAEGLSGWTVFADGVGNSTSTQMLARANSSGGPGGILGASSGLQPKRVAAFELQLVNDQPASDGNLTTAQSLARLAAGVAALRIAGYKVCTPTTLDWVNNLPVAYDRTQVPIFNAAVLSNPGKIYGDVIVDVASDARLQAGPTSYDGTYRLASGLDVGHLTTAGAGVYASIWSAAAATL